MSANKLSAGSPFPPTRVQKLGGGEIDLATPSDGHDWRLVIVYRGKHCPICSRYLGGVNDLLSQYSEQGVDIVAVSADPEEKASIHMEPLKPSFPVGYGLTIEQMQALGLYISDPRSPEETDRPFAEPGLFLVNGDGNIQVTDISNAPFSRPDLASLVKGITFIRDPANKYPIRGTHT